MRETGSGQAAPAETADGGNPASPSPSAASKLSPDDIAHLRAYSVALMNAMTANGLQKASSKFWDNEVPDEGDERGRLVAAIYEEHRKRVNNEAIVGTVERNVAAMLNVVTV